MKLAYSKPPILHLSASAIAQLTTCPEQFRLRRIKKIPESRGLDKFIGTVDHETMEMTLRYKMRNKFDVPMEELPGMYDHVWDNSIQEEGIPDFQGNNPSDIREHGQLMAALYHEAITPTIKPKAIEERFEETIGGVPIPIVGYADVVESGRIVEKKTSKAKVSTPKPQWLLQGRLYQLTYEKPIEWNVITKQKTPQILTPDNAPELRLESSDKDQTAAIVRQAWNLLSDLWNRYGEDKEWPVFGLQHPFACNMCGFGPKYGGKCIAWSSNTPF